MMRNQYFLASLFLTSRILWRLSLLAATADHFLSKRRLDILFARARRVGVISYVGIDFSTEWIRQQGSNGTLSMILVGVQRRFET